MVRLICIDDRSWLYRTSNQINAIGFGAGHEGQGATLTSAGDNNNAAGASLVALAATVNAILAQVLRADTATKVSAINLDFTLNRSALNFVLHGLAQLVRHDPCGLVLDAKLAAQLDG